MPTITRDTTASLSFGPQNTLGHIDRIHGLEGFLGAVLLGPIFGSGDPIFYGRWASRDAAISASEAGSELGTLVLDTLDVRVKAAPHDGGGVMPIVSDGTVALVVRMAVDPDRSEELLAELTTATDAFLPDFGSVHAVAFHRTPDRRHVVEYLQASGAVAMALTQLKPRLRRHMRLVEQIADTVEPHLCRVLRALEADDAGTAP